VVSLGLRTKKYKGIRIAATTSKAIARRQKAIVTLDHFLRADAVRGFGDRDKFFSSVGGCVSPGGSSNGFP